MLLLPLLTIVFGALSFCLAVLLLKQNYAKMPAKKPSTQRTPRLKQQHAVQTPSSGAKGAAKVSAPQKNPTRKSNLVRYDELKMVIVIRTDLKMEKGKMAAQCCHAAVEAAEIARDVIPFFPVFYSLFFFFIVFFFFKQHYSELYKQWKRSGSAKIVLKCNSESELIELEEKGKALGLVTASICDAGRTQIAPGSLTCCAFGPQSVSVINEITGHLKLL